MYEFREYLKAYSPDSPVRVIRVKEFPDFEKAISELSVHVYDSRFLIYDWAMFNLRKHFLLDPAVTFLNHGSFGATPKPVLREYRRWQKELEKQPVEFLGRRFNALMAESRAALGSYLGTHADNLVYTQNATISINIVARSLELGVDDEVLTSDHEYGAMDRTWRFLSKERGFTYVNQPTSTPLVSEEQFVNDFWQGITPRTRVIFLSHIT
jgi:isopenicillin-N epimerase